MAPPASASPQTLLIDTDTALEDAIPYLDEAIVVGIDAEWPPDTTGHSPAATLLQLATYSSKNGLNILLLDLVQLDSEDVAPPLQRLFRSSTTLKLGWSLSADVHAIAAALGRQRGPGVVAVINSILDLKSLHRYLLHQGMYDTVLPPCGEGLSGVLESQFGERLDKSQQCSAWGVRPMTSAQITYAATDAGCLLGLLDSYIECCCCCGVDFDDSADSRGSGGGGGAAVVVSSSTIATTTETTEEAEDEGVVSSASQQQQQEGTKAITDARDDTSRGEDKAKHTGQAPLPPPPPSPQSRQQQLSNKKEKEHLAVIRASNVTWTPETISKVIALWSQRWELASGGRIRRSGGTLHVSSTSSSSNAPSSRNTTTLGKNNKNTSSKLSKQSIPLSSVLPSHIPWMNSDHELTAPPKFIVDVMLHGAARQLRLWGFDAESVDTIAKQQRHVVHRQLVTRAEAEDRVILTRDVTFMRRRLSDQAYFVSANDKQSQLEEVVKVFNLPIDKDSLLSRCARCNGEFFDHPVKGECLPDGSGVLPEVAAREEVEFWVCKRCGAAYWQGNMYNRAMERLSDKMDKLKVGG